MSLSIDESSAYETEYLRRNLNQLVSSSVAIQQGKDLGWVAFGCAQPSLVDKGCWLHLERMKSDFIQNGTMA
jgi:hypothetical protein